MEYAESNAHFMTFVDDKTAFALFLAVRPPLERISSLPKRQCRTGICRWYISSGCLLVSGIAVSPSHTKSTFADNVAAYGLLQPSQPVSNFFQSRHSVRQAHRLNGS